MRTTYRGKPVDKYVYLFNNLDIRNGFVYGSLVVSRDKYYICTSAIVKVNSVIDNSDATMVEVFPETVNQSLGIYDIHSNEIFEDDIVKYSNMGKSNVGYVEYKLGVYQIYDNDCCPVIYMCSDIEIIGNVRNNSEILQSIFNKVGNKDV